MTRCTALLLAALLTAPAVASAQSYNCTFRGCDARDRREETRRLREDLETHMFNEDRARRAEQGNRQAEDIMRQWDDERRNRSRRGCARIVDGYCEN